MIATAVEILPVRSVVQGPAFRALSDRRDIVSFKLRVERIEASLLRRNGRGEHVVVFVKEALQHRPKAPRNDKDIGMLTQGPSLYDAALEPRLKVLALEVARPSLPPRSATCFIMAAYSSSVTLRTCLDTLPRTYSMLVARSSSLPPKPTSSPLLWMDRCARRAEDNGCIFSHSGTEKKTNSLTKKTESLWPTMDDLSIADVIGDLFPDDENAVLILTQETTVTGEDPMLCEFPELNFIEVSEYTATNAVAHYDPFDTEVVGVTEDSTSDRRRSELKRLHINGWMRSEVDSKRKRFKYIAPDGTTVTSLKDAMKTINLAAVIDLADQDTLDAAEKCAA